MANKRLFYVDTPLGKIKVWAKHAKDEPKNFPGVYVDFIPNGCADDNGNEHMLCVVEYDSIADCIQSCIYQPSSEEPVSIIIREEEDA